MTGDANVGLVDYVELSCEGPVHWTANGSLTTVGRGTCRLRAVVERVYHVDDRIRVDLHFSDGGLSFVELADGAGEPAVGAKVVLQDAAITLWSENL
jgi:hypothetical protein